MQSINSMLFPISQTASKRLQNHLESWRVGYGWSFTAWKGFRIYTTSVLTSSIL